MSAGTDIEALRAHLDAGRVDRALAFGRDSVARHPHNPQVLHLYGLALLRAGQPAAAERWLRRAAATLPDDPRVHVNLGAAYDALGCLDEAIASTRRGAAIGANLFMAHYNLGVLLLKRQAIPEAIEALGRAVAIEPGTFAGANALATAYSMAGRLDEALAQAHSATETASDQVEGHVTRGIIELKRCESGAAHASFERAMTLDPDSAVARLAWTTSHLGHAYPSSNDVRRAYQAFTAALEALVEWTGDDPARLVAIAEAIGRVQPFHLGYLHGSHRAVLERYGDFAARAMAAWRAARCPVARESPLAGGRRERVRLAVVSRFFDRQSVWDMITHGLVCHIDHGRFEVIGYRTNSVPDSEPETARGLLDALHSGPRPLARWVERIEADAPDAILYPELGMDPVSYQLAAMRLAPLQLSTWGHPQTSGLATVDVFLSGELLEDPDADAHYRETLVRLPGVGVCVEALGLAARTAVVPGLDLGTGPRPAVLLSCQQVQKYHPDHDELFARIAAGVAAAGGECRIVFFRFDNTAAAFPVLRERIEASFRRRRLDPARHCVFAEQLPRPEFLGLLERADVYLDTVAFSGFTTAFQALERGLPVVTLEGPTLRQRLAAGLLRRIGVADTVVADADAYVRAAVRLSCEPDTRAALAERIRAGFPRAVGDRRAVRGFEAAVLERASPVGRPEGPGPAELGSADPAPEGPAALDRDQIAREPWRLLDRPDGVHLASLNRDYVPKGLLDLLDAPPRRVLDVGCFVGATGARLKARFPGCEVIGIEPVAAAARRAAAALDRVHQARLEDLDFGTAGLGPGSVDVIVLADVLEHMVNPWRALERLRPLLAPGGVVLASIPNVRNLALLDALARGRWTYEGAGLLDVTHLRFFTRAEIEALFAQTGYALERVVRNIDSRCRALVAPHAPARVETASLVLKDVDETDRHDLATLQFYVRAVTAPGPRT